MLVFIYTLTPCYNYKLLSNTLSDLDKQCCVHLSDRSVNKNSTSIWCLRESKECQALMNIVLYNVRQLTKFSNGKNKNHIKSIRYICNNTIINDKYGYWCKVCIEK